MLRSKFSPHCKLSFHISFFQVCSSCYICCFCGIYLCGGDLYLKTVTSSSWDLFILIVTISILQTSNRGKVIIFRSTHNSRKFLLTRSHDTSKFKLILLAKNCIRGVLFMKLRIWHLWGSTIFGSKQSLNICIYSRSYPNKSRQKHYAYKCKNKHIPNKMCNDNIDDFFCNGMYNK